MLGIRWGVWGGVPFSYPSSYDCCRWRAAASMAWAYLALLSMMPIILWPICEHVCALTRAFPFRLAVFRTADSRLSIFCWPRSRWRRRPRRRRPNTRSKYACEREMEVTLSRDAARLMGTLKDMMDLATSEDGISIGLPCPRSHGLDASDGVQPERQLLNDPDQSPMPSSLT